jgi:hypothetical protein
MDSSNSENDEVNDDPYAYGYTLGRGLTRPPWWVYQWENGRKPDVYEMLRGWVAGYEAWQASERAVAQAVALQKRQAERKIKESR